MPTPARPLRRTAVLAALAAAASTTVACGDDAVDTGRAAPAPAAAAAPERQAPARDEPVRIEAGEYFFRGPSRLPAGPTTFELRNVGRETHQLAVARLAPGVSVERAIRTGGEGGTATPLGEVVARPGVRAELYTVLKPGRHVLLCFEEGGRGKPHLALGQRSTIDVR